MHFEVLVEDQSGSIALDVVPEKILGAKCEWAGRIARHMDVDGNRSPSFQVFRDGVRDLAGT